MARLLIGLLMAWPAFAETPPVALKLREARAELAKLDKPADPAPAEAIGSEDMGKVKVGAVVEFESRRPPLTCLSVLGKDSAVVRYTDRSGNIRLTAVVKSTSTEGWVDGRYVTPTGPYKVSGTEKVEGSTMFVLEPVKPGPAAAAKAKAYRDAELKVGDAKAARDREAAAVWEKELAAVIAAALKANEIPAEAAGEDKARALLAQDKAVRSAVAEARQQLTKRYDLTPEEANKLLPKK